MGSQNIGSQPSPVTMRISKSYSKPSNKIAPRKSLSGWPKVSKSPAKLFRTYFPFIYSRFENKANKYFLSMAMFTMKADV